MAATCTGPGCDEPLTGRQTAYHATICATRAQNAARKASGKMASNRRRQKAREMVDKPCGGCGTLVRRWKFSERTPTCSDWCMTGVRTGWPQSAIPDRHPMLSTAIPRCHAVYRQPCAECGATCLAMWPGVKRCSGRCEGRRAATRWREKRDRVIERDGRACGLCGGDCPPDAVYPDDLAAVADHVLPRAHGGSDEESNLQCAHRLCNERKGDTIGWSAAIPLPVELSRMP